MKVCTLWKQRRILLSLWEDCTQGILKELTYTDEELVSISLTSQCGSKQIFSVYWNSEETGGDGICNHIRYVEFFEYFPPPSLTLRLITLTPLCICRSPKVREGGEAIPVSKYWTVPVGCWDVVLVHRLKGSFDYWWLTSFWLILYP